jgi:hypothetical protein
LESVGNPSVIYRPREDSNPQAELDALAAVYRYVLSHSEVRKGGPHDLTNHPTKECMTRLDKKGTGNADLHGD